MVPGFSPVTTFLMLPLNMLHTMIGTWFSWASVMAVESMTLRCRRKELGKLARKSGEEAKVAVRNVRRDANDQLKKLEKDKAISEDELKKATDDVQKLTDKYVAKVDEKCAAKEKEIMDL